jgi:hypothetical protein
LRIASPKPAAQARVLLQSPTRQQGLHSKARRASKGSSSKPAAPARVAFQSPPRQQGLHSKARRASKGCILKYTLAGAAGFEDVLLPPRLTLGGSHTL